MQKKNEKTAKEAPLLAWLKQHGFCPTNTKQITKQQLLAAFDRHKVEINRRVTHGGGVRLSKATAMHTLKEAFLVNKVYEL